jgi:hypothetical protein
MVGQGVERWRPGANSVELVQHDLRLQALERRTFYLLLEGAGGLNATVWAKIPQQNTRAAFQASVFLLKVSDW